MRYLLSLFFISSFIFNVTAQTATGIQFIENKGQWNDRVHYKVELGNGAFFLTEKGYTTMLYNSNDFQQLRNAMHGLKNADEVVLRGHAIAVEFMNALKPVAIPNKQKGHYNNYFIGNDAAKWKSHCKLSEEVTYKGLYKGIDVRYYSAQQSIKYDIIVHPGAEINEIALNYTGANSLRVENGELLISTSIGEWKESAPFAYQEINGSKKHVDCNYVVDGTTVKFSAAAYDKSKPLIIDPALVFCTFTGSTADNWGYAATYSADGTVYGAGVVFNNGFPASTGAFQTTFQGGVSSGSTAGHDIGIIKYTADGTNKIYATYIGSNGNEESFSLVATASGELVVAGITYSGFTASYPTTLPAIGPGGGTDIVITKLNATGTALINSRRIGGTSIDGVNIRQKSINPSGATSIRRNYGDDMKSEVVLDNAGNILLASQTQSWDFPVTANAFQNSFGGGVQDAVVLKLSADLSTVHFSSFLGGNGDDGGFSIAPHPSNSNIYVGGSTTSTNFPGDKNATLSATYNGGVADGYVSIINSDGTSILKSTYIGTSGIDMLYNIKFDRSGFPYILGTTTGTWQVVNAAFSQANGKQYIAKLSPDLSSYQYSTMFGKGQANPDICPIAFGVDKCENIYISGWGGSINTSQNYPNSGTTGLTVTSNAIKTSTDGSDFYVMALARNATGILYGSFFGETNGVLGDHVDGGTSRFDSSGTLYMAMCACQSGPTFPVTAGSWSTTNPATSGGSCNLAVAKIAFNYCLDSVNLVMCPNGSTTLTTSVAGASYQWQVNTGSGFVNISNNNNNYNGVNTASLQLNNIPSFWYGYQYRCLVDGNPAEPFIISFRNTWQGNIDSNWENPFNWSCGIVPDPNTDVVINAGTVTINSNVTIRTLNLNPAATLTVTPGYTLTVLR